MPAGFQQLGPSLFYGDTPPNGPSEGWIWFNGSGQEQIFQNGRWRNLPAGYVPGTGDGGAVTQITNRSTGVTLNALTGTITTDPTSLGAELSAAFVVTNNRVAIGDVVVLAQQSGSNGGNTELSCYAVAAGSFTIRVSNNNAAGGTAETGAILINFAVIKGAVT